MTDDYQFLSSSTIAKVDAPASANQVLAGTGLGLLHAYDGAHRARRAGLPEGDGRLAVRARRDRRRRATPPPSPARATCSSGTPTSPSASPTACGRATATTTTGRATPTTDGVAPGHADRGDADAGRGRQVDARPSPRRATTRCAGRRTPTRRAPGTPDVDRQRAGRRRRAAAATAARSSLSAVDEAGNRGIPVRVDYDLPPGRRRPRPPTAGPATASPGRTATPDYYGIPAPQGSATPAPGRVHRPRRADVADHRRPRAQALRARPRHRPRPRAAPACAACPCPSRARSARAAAASCGGPGKFGPKRRCAKHRFVPATGTARWRLRIKGRMPVGRYVATTRARDRRDNLEGPGERVRFRRRA